MQFLENLPAKTVDSSLPRGKHVLILFRQIFDNLTTLMILISQSIMGLPNLLEYKTVALPGLIRAPWCLHSDFPAASAALLII